MSTKFSLSLVTKKKLLGTLAGVFFLALVFTIVFYLYALDIAREQIITSTRSVIDSSLQSKPVIYLGVISRYPPNILYHGYQPILDYLTSKTPYRFGLKLSDDYNQAVQMLVRKEVAAAFLGSYVYVRAHREHGIIPILKPLNENFEPFSRSVVITSISGTIYSINELKGKRIALPSKESFSSIWLMRNEIRKHGIREEDFAEIRNFPHHQSVIHNVAKNVYDVGVTREYLVKKLINKSLRVLLYSDPVPTSPIVAAADYPKDIIIAIKKTLLALNQTNPDRAAITKGWDVEFVNGFVEAFDHDYDIIRALKQ
jgi:phosphonate transport system substrate-binding protein